MRRLEFRRLLRNRVWPVVRCRECRLSSHRSPLIAFRPDVSSATPLLLAHLVHGLVQRFDEMEAVDDERHMGGSGA